MTPTRFREGDKVIVPWLDGDRTATVVELELRNGKPHKVPCYRVVLDGADEHRLGYRENEMRRA